ncbi:nuclear transport factor 2 family protein [Rathayibacter sp. CAU 1779]
MDTTSPAAIARAYIEAVGDHDLPAVDALLADSLQARVGTGTSDKSQWLAALGRLLPALERNDIRDVYENADHACVVYDFVTDTPAGAVVCVENLHLADGRITDIELVFDKVAFAPVNDALRERAAV